MGKKDKRKDPRYDVDEKISILTAPKLVISDNLIDISLGGLSFSYEDKDPFHSGVWIKMDIISGNVSILDIPVKIISDTEMPYSPKLSRQCSVAFGNLSKEQRTKLQLFVDKFGIAP